MQHKIKWRTLKFIPIGGDESQAIGLKQTGFMRLCQQLRDSEGFSGYTIHDTKGYLEGYSGNVNVDWSDFQKAMLKHHRDAPPEKPSVFQGVWFPPEHTIEMRKRLLAAVCREYITAESLANDLLEWLAKGRNEDLREFVLWILRRIKWEQPNTPSPISTTPGQPKGVGQQSPAEKFAPPSS